MSNEEKIIDLLNRILEDVAGLKQGQIETNRHFDKVDSRFDKIDADIVV